MNRVPPKRRLSIGTLFYRRVAPVFFLGASAIIVGLTATIGTPSVMDVVPILVEMGVGYAIMQFIASDLADEVLDGGDHLVVRKDGVEELVSFIEIEEVKESIWHRGPPRVELVLRAPGRLGRVIVFTPLKYSLVPFERSAVYYELTDRVARAQREAHEVPSTPHQA